MWPVAKRKGSDLLGDNIKEQKGKSQGVDVESLQNKNYFKQI